MVPELAMAAEVDGKMVGAAFGLPDYNPRIRDIDGRLFPFGFIHLLRKKHHIKTHPLDLDQRHSRVPAAGPGHGADAAASFPRCWSGACEEAEFSWVLESNSLSRGALQKGGAKLTKTYRIYDLDEPPAYEGWNPRSTALRGCRLRSVACQRGGRSRWKFVPSARRRDVEPIRPRPLAHLCRRPAVGAAAA